MSAFAFLGTLHTVIQVLGLGTCATAGFSALAFWYQRYAYIFMIVAAVSAAATFVYAKGVHDEYAAASAASNAAVQSAVQQATQIRAKAVRSLHVPRPGGVRDPYARD